MDLSKIQHSKVIERVLFVVVALIVALVIFQAGVFVGYRKAEFSERFGESYERTFGSHDTARGLVYEDVPGGYGASGNIVRISAPTFVVAGPDNLEKVVVMDDHTEIRRLRETLSAQDLKIDDAVVVLGSPDEKGEIVARLIRVLPPPATPTTSATTTFITH